ncbi:MAG: prepilin-type N-terminal cleavage/methylation domain-containing protein [Nitrospirota bacterium]
MTNKKGFTLIEVMISVALLALGILAISSGTMTVLTHNRRSADNMRAIAAAENMIEMIRSDSNQINTYNGFNTGNEPIVNPVAMAAKNFNIWQTQVKAISPGAFGTIVIGVAPSMLTVQTVAVQITIGNRVIILNTLVI